MGTCPTNTDGSLTPFVAKYCTALAYDMDMLRTMSAQELICAMSEKLNEAVGFDNETREIANGTDKYVKSYMGSDEWKNDLDEAANGVAGQLEQQVSANTAAIATKVTQGQADSVTWAMIAQDARENISGDKTAVVGPDSVNTSAIVDGAVTPQKTSFASSRSGFLPAYSTGTINIGSDNVLISDANYKSATYKVENGKTYYAMVAYDATVGMFFTSTVPTAGQAGIKFTTVDYSQPNVAYGAFTAPSDGYITLTNRKTASGDFVYSENRLCEGVAPSENSIEKITIVPSTLIDDTSIRPYTLQPWVFKNATFYGNLINAALDDMATGYIDAYGDGKYPWVLTGSGYIIPIKPGHTYRSSYGYIGFLDANFNAIPVTNSGDRSIIPVTAPENSFYLIVAKSPYSQKVWDTSQPEPNFTDGYWAFGDTPPSTEKSALIIGDSLSEIGTADRGWLKYFVEKMNIGKLDNISVSGARWCDYNNSTVYNGKPEDYSGQANEQNVIGNQVQKVLNNRSSFQDNYGMIIILAGTNDLNSTVPSYDDIEEQFYTGTNKKPLASVDRSTWPGAFRWAIENLRDAFSDTPIFIVSPFQRWGKGFFEQIENKIEIERICSDRVSCKFIDTIECGVYDMNSTGTFPSGDLNDGLHLTAQGAKKVGEYVAAAIKIWLYGME